jgi:hypothetical protein
MNEIDVDTDGDHAPIADQPKEDVTAEIEVPPQIWERAERRAAAAGGDRSEFLLDHLMIDYEFRKSTASAVSINDTNNPGKEIWEEHLIPAHYQLVKDDVDLSAAREQLAAAIEKIDQLESDQ